MCCCNWRTYSSLLLYEGQWETIQATRVQETVPLCKGKIVTYTSATVNTGKILNLSSGIATINMSGLYSISFYGIPTHDSQETGVEIRMKRGNTIEILSSPSSRQGSSPLSSSRLRYLIKGDQIFANFCDLFGSEKNCLFSGKNDKTVKTIFTVVRMRTQMSGEQLSPFISPKKKSVKKILLWNSPNRDEVAIFGTGHQPFIDHGCPITICYIQANSSEF